MNATKCTCNPGSIQVCPYCAKQDKEWQDSLGKVDMPHFNKAKFDQQFNQIFNPTKRDAI